jgi:hypothetical protein
MQSNDNLWLSYLSFYILALYYLQAQNLFSVQYVLLVLF